MVSRSVLLVLLVLVCLQTVTTSQNGNGPTACCFSYQTHRIPVKRIKGYKVTEQQCANPGVIFTLEKDQRVCADPTVQWVKTTIDKIKQGLTSKPAFESSRH